MNIVFFGSDDFSNSILNTLIENNFKPVLVLTSPDKPKGRGKKTLPTQVKLTALDNNIPILTPIKITKDIVEEIRAFGPQVFVTISYGLMLPVSLLNLVKYPLNIHPSLLPKYRGASPIRTCLINGDTKTGVTIMKMVKKMDAGDIYSQKSLIINNDDDYLSLKSKLIDLSKSMIIDILKSIENFEPLSLAPQSGEVTFCSKFEKSDFKINWQESSYKILNKLRAFSDIGLFTFLNGQRIKIFSAQLSNREFEPSQIVVENKNVFVGTKDKALKILKIQFPGKKPINVKDALNGGKFKNAKRFSDG